MFTPEFLASLTKSELFSLYRELVTSREDKEFATAVLQEMKSRK